MALQDKLSQGMSKFQKKMVDTHITTIGTSRCSTLYLKFEEDKFGDGVYTLKSYGTILTYIGWPDQEIPLPDRDKDNESGMAVHLYDFLPVEIFTKFSDSYQRTGLTIEKGCILLTKVKMPDGTFNLIPLEIVDRVGRANYSEVVWIKSLGAPYTLQIEKYPEIRSVIDEFLAEDDEIVVE